jgi:hypothetical protein
LFRDFNTIFSEAELGWMYHAGRLGIISLNIYFQCRLTCCFSLCLLYFNIEKKSYGNIDEVEKHSHQVATKFLNTILNVLLNEKKYISMLIQTRALRFLFNILDQIWKRFPIVKFHIFFRIFLWKLKYYINYILYIMYNVQDYSFLYDNAVCPVISEDWHFTHMWKALVGQHHFTTRGSLDP